MSDFPMERVKLLCSYGGRIQPRPHDRKLSYVGGDTKILTVERNISFSNLLAKLHNLCDYNSEIRVKYKLPEQDLDALISVFEDDDVNNMMFEYDYLRRISAKPARIRLFVFFPVTATATPVTARSPNPDFLFGFDKEYSFTYPAAVKKSEIPEFAGMVVSGNVGSGGGDPNQIQDISVQNPDDRNVTRGSYVYPAPLVYRVPVAPGGYFQARGIGNREQPVVYGFIPVLPSSVQQQRNIPLGASPVGYDGTNGESQHQTVKMGATCNQESKVSPRAPHDG